MINKKSLESLIYAGALDAFGDRSSLLASTINMTVYLKEIQTKKDTSQTGLFDMGVEGISASHFDLTKASPMSFEDRMKGEKAMIGYPVSGHPLDGMEEYIRSKSKNLGKVLDWIETKGMTKPEELSTMESEEG